MKGFDKGVYSGDDDMPDPQPMPRRRPPKEEGEDRKHERDHMRNHDDLTLNGRREKGLGRRLPRRRAPRGRNDQTRPPR